MPSGRLLGQRVLPQVGNVTAESVRKLCLEGQLEEAVEGLGVLVRGGCGGQDLFYFVLRKCGVKKDLVLGRRVHALAVGGGYETDAFLCNHVLRMYAAHGRLQEAMDVFAMVGRPSGFMWSSMMSAHVHHGEAREAVELYRRMRVSGVKADGHVFVAALQACGRGVDLRAGRMVHADVLASGVEVHLFVWNCLVDMYGKCGSLEEARGVFDGLVVKDVVTWNAMMSGYSQHGMGEEALRVYSAMQQQEGGALPDSVTFVCLLQACASVGATALEEGKQVHARIRDGGLEGHVFVANSLVNMYAKCGSLEDARRVFDGLGEKDVVTWTALIAGHAQQGMGRQALQLYDAMQDDGIAVPDSVTFVALLQVCASLGTPALEKGKQLHSQIGEQGLTVDAVVGCSLVNMYAKCGSLEDAQRVFDGISGPKYVAAWNAMIAGYAKFGSLKEARRMFDGLGQRDEETWGVLIAGYSQRGMGQDALSLYRDMQENGISAPDSTTLVCLLQACASVGTAALEQGRQLHAQIRERGLEADVFVSSSLVNMYAKCCSLEDAQAVFDGLDQKNVVAWNAMIAGYSQQGMGDEALRLYKVMQDHGVVTPDSVTFVCLLQACANVAALHLGRQLHAQIKEQGLQADVIIGNSLINMYGKSGSMVDALQVFEALPEKDVVTWNALIAGYTRQGDSATVLQLFHKMVEAGIQPTSVTFLSVLTVCSHAGLVDKGREYFEAMRIYYHITPAVEHYTSMVDLLGRAGQLDESLALVKGMPVLPSASVWDALLHACRKWNNLEVGRYAFHEAVKMDKKHSAPYVLMSNIYTGAQMWEQAQEMQARRIGSGAWKQPGQSWWTDMDGLVHSFLVGDKKEKHPEIAGIYARLLELSSQVKQVGYMQSSPSDISDNAKKTFCALITQNSIANQIPSTPLNLSGSP